MNDNLYKKNIDCPMCKNSFKTSKVRTTRIRVEKTDTNLFKHFVGDNNPYFYEINVCPKCGFSFSDNFSGEITRDNMKLFFEKITTNWTGKDYTGERDISIAIETFKLALLTANIMGLKASIMGGICYRIGCLYRTMDDQIESKRFLEDATQFYNQAYSHEDLNQESSIRPETLVFLLGELSYQLGDYKAASKWFEMAIMKYTNNNPEVSQGMIRTIRDRWMDIKPDILARIHEG